MKIAISLISIMFLTSCLFAQEEEFARVGVNEPFYVEEEEQESEADQNVADIPENFRHYKKLSEYYEGYMVEMLVVDFPVGRNHALLSQYGKIYYDINQETGNHHYFLLIPFEADQMSQKFYEGVIKPKVPDSKLVYRSVKKKKPCKSCFSKF